MLFLALVDAEIKPKEEVVNDPQTNKEENQKDDFEDKHNDDDVALVDVETKPKDEVVNDLQTNKEENQKDDFEDKHNDDDDDDVKSGQKDDLQYRQDQKDDNTYADPTATNQKTGTR